MPPRTKVLPAQNVAAQASGAQTGIRARSFVITLWLEARSADEPEWRWRVIQVQTGERRHFHRLQDVLTYVSIEAGVWIPQ